MPWADFYGQETVKKTLQQGLRSGTLPNSLLFVGPDEIGMEKMARLLAQALNCLGSSDDPCGRCSPCQALAKGNFPDVLEIGLDKEAGKKSAGIDEIREIRELALLRPMTGRHRVFIIENAERISLEAANALLKILEEPPAHAYFILITKNPELLPATIQSRCRLISFKPLNPEEIERALLSSGMPAERARLAAILAEGSLDRALSLDWEQVMAERQLAWHYFSQLVTAAEASGFFKILSSSRQEIIRRDLASLFRFFLTFWRDLLLLQEKGDEDRLLNPDLKEDLKKLSVELTSEACLQGIDLAEEVLSGLERNLNPKLLTAYFYAQVRRKENGRGCSTDFSDHRENHPSPARGGGSFRR